MPPIKFFFPDVEDDVYTASKEPDRGLTMDQYRSEASRLMINKKFNKANYYFKKSLLFSKDNVTALSNRSYCNLKLGNVKLAMKDIDQVILKQPTNITALLLKADIYFAMGQLELALMFFCRGHSLGAKLKRPLLWIYICQTAIGKIIGDQHMLVTTDGDLGFLQKQIDKDSISNSSMSFEAKRKLMVTKKDDKMAFDSILDISMNPKLVNLMGNLYNDRLYIENTFNQADMSSRIGKQICKRTFDMIQYIDKQVIKRLYEKAPGDITKRMDSLPSIAQQKNQTNLAVTRELNLIDLEQRENRFEESLARAEALLEGVLAYPEGVVRKMEEVIATIYGYMGNAHLKLDDLNSSLLFFRKEKYLSNRHHLLNTKLHSLYYIGVVTALQGDFNKATNIWSIRLSYAKSAAERCWLLHEMGRSQYALGDFEKALAYGNKALNEAIEMEDNTWLLNCFVLRAQIEVRIPEFAEALKSYNEALSIAQNIMNDDELTENIENSIKDITDLIELALENRGLTKSDIEEPFKSVQVQTKKTEFPMADEMYKQEEAFLADLEGDCGGGVAEEAGKKESQLTEMENDFFPAKYRDNTYRNFFGSYSRLTEESYAFVTMATNDTYAIGALVLAQTLKQVETKHDLVVMVTSEVSEEIVVLLRESFNLVKCVLGIDSQDQENLSLLQRHDLGITFTKLHAWRLVQYDKAVFLDADTIVLKNIDELFERDPFSAAPDSGWPDCFNSGVFLYKPSQEMFRALMDFAFKVGSFDGGDQGLLNLFFADWATKDIKFHLPVTYNLPWHSYYSYKPALKQFGDKVKIIHFIGNPKPWAYDWDPIFQRVISQPIEAPQNSELLQLWWDVFMTDVQKRLPKNSGGILGRLSDLKVRSLAAHTEFYLKERQRQYCWEDNKIDYMGDDRFENIQKKLDMAIEAGKTGTLKAPIRCIKISTIAGVKTGNTSKFTKKKD